MSEHSYNKYISELPVGAVTEQVNETLKRHSAVVITAPPGAGKSTLLPLTIFEGLADKNEKILLLEPRRIAARQIAERMAEMSDSAVGDHVGYAVRFDRHTSANTRIEVLTEGLLTRRIVTDPTLDGVSVVIFDEFHERSLNTDIAFALVRETQRTIRQDLRIVVMSATIDARAICNALDAPLIESEGRMFDVDIVHEEEADAGNCVETVVRTIRKACTHADGSMLVFLPGQKEIRRCMEKLHGALPECFDVYPLYGQLSVQEQKRAVMPARGKRKKIVLATSIAETSLTIEGVNIVIDSGLCRRQVFSPHNGLSHLATVRISMDMAQQRSGRAGRLSAGVCYRLWSKATEHRMAECRKPEIIETDLTHMVLDIAAWGGNKTECLPWLTPPPSAHLAYAQELLAALGAVDEKHNVTNRGMKLADLPCHPRIANMLVNADSKQKKALAADIAALLEEKSPCSNEEDADINTQIALLRDVRKKGKGGAWSRIVQVAQQYRDMVHVAEDDSAFSAQDTGALIAAAYPERIARHEKGNTYRLACNETAVLSSADDLNACEFLAVASLDRRIFLASPIGEEDVERHASIRNKAAWDREQGRVCAIEELRVGCIVLSSKRLDSIAYEEEMRIATETVRKDGISLLNFDDKYERLRKRIAMADKWHPDLGLPDVSMERVLEKASEWFPMYVERPVTANKMKKVDLSAVVWGWLSYEQQHELDDIAPAFVTVPTGSRIKIDYREDMDNPVLSVRLQECFGMKETPRIDKGRTPVIMELLSPGFKPVQLTKDLGSFWNNAYYDVRKELKRRYPKHYWPDNPLEAEAVKGVKRTQKG